MKKRGHIAIPGRGLHFAQLPLQLLDACRRNACRGPLHNLGLQQPAQLTDAQCLGIVELHHRVAVVHPTNQQSAALQVLQRLPHRNRTDPETVDQLALHDPLSGLEHSSDDISLQVMHDVVAQGTRTKRAVLRRLGDGGFDEIRHVFPLMIAPLTMFSLYIVLGWRDESSVSRSTTGL